VLITHCGITWTKIGATFWRATRPLSDGKGNPPPGWDNPAQAGTLTIDGPGLATFRSSAGVVTFQPTARGQSPMLCS
jgi:hypothetical protein